MSERHPLIEAYLNDELDDAGYAQFQDWLREDPEHLKQWALAAFVDRELSACLGGESGEASERMAETDAVTDHAGATRRGLLDSEVLQALEQIEASSECSGIVDIADLIAQSKQDESSAREAADAADAEDAEHVSVREVFSVAGYLGRRTLANHIVAISAIAAVLILGVALFFVLQDDGAQNEPPIAQTPAGPETQTTHVATLTGGHDAQWRTAAGPVGLDIGDALRPGQRLTLTDGFAQLTTRDGAVALLESPCTIELIDHDNAIRLVRGKLVGIVETEQAQGFLVRTPHMDVVDLGTRFGIDATRPEATEVHVFEGEVQAVGNRSDQANATAKSLTAGQSAVASDSDRQVSLIAYNPARFAAIGMQTLVLPGTGIGLSGGDPDPNWRVVAFDGQRLEGPVAMRCKTYSGERSTLAIPPNDPATGQWITFYYPETDSGAETLRYTVEVDLTIPYTVDLSRANLDAVFQADNALSALRVNGQLVRHPGVVSTPHTLIRLDDLTLDALGIRHGQNSVQFDIENDRGSVSGIHMRWRLVDALNQDPN